MTEPTTCPKCGSRDKAVRMLLEPYPFDSYCDNDWHDTPPDDQEKPAVAEYSEKIWYCKIGGKCGELPRGADYPMRLAIQDAFQKVTGSDDEFCFSGWAAKLTEAERAVVENRLPNDSAPVAGNTGSSAPTSAAETVAKQDVLVPAAGGGDLCDICKLPLEGVRIGHGDGTGNRFAHPDCYWREQAEMYERQRDEARREAETLRRGIFVVAELIAESDGVSGLHRNGDIAVWGSLRTKGEFEAWLLEFDKALEVANRG